MAPVNTARSERINLRLSEAAKRRIEHAASVEGTTVSGFIVSSALETAERTIDRHETMALARQDAMRFFDALADPRRRTTGSARRLRNTPGASVHVDRSRCAGHRAARKTA